MSFQTTFTKKTLIWLQRILGSVPTMKNFRVVCVPTYTRRLQFEFNHRKNYILIILL